MNPEVLLVDDAEEFRQLAAQFLAIEWPDVEVDEWDPRARGEIPSFFRLAEYDVLLLDSDLGLGDALEWLARLIERADCPPVVFMIDADDDNLALKALQRGAFDYVSKRDLSRTRLVEVVRAAAAERSARSAAGRAPWPAPVEHRDVLDLIKANVPPVPRGGIDDGAEVAINGYRMLQKIGSGGMATVYLAERTADRLRLVMKIMKAKLSEDNEFLKRFIQEYGLVSKIECPHVVRIYDQGVTDRHVYIAMEYFPGGDLRARIREGLEPDESLNIVRDVAQALQAVHAQGIVHRDLKPDNVMFRADGNLAIADFGIATRSSSRADLTAQGDVLGTPHYLSPEQACGRAVDGRSDLYSLGIVLFEMLTGRRPFRAKDAKSLAEKHVHDPLPRLPVALARYQELVDCLTAKRSDDRFSGATELIAYLEANAVTLRSAARSLAFAGGDRSQSMDERPTARAGLAAIKDRTSERRTAESEKRYERPAMRNDSSEGLVDVPATLERLGGDTARFNELARTLPTAVQPLLTLLAEGLNDSNLHFVCEAARLLKRTIDSVEAPEVLHSVADLEGHAYTHDFSGAAAAFLTTHRLVRRLMTELTRATPT